MCMSKGNSKISIYSNLWISLHLRTELHTGAKMPRHSCQSLYGVIQAPCFVIYYITGTGQNYWAPLTYRTVNGLNLQAEVLHAEVAIRSWQIVLPWTIRITLRIKTLVVYPRKSSFHEILTTIFRVHAVHHSGFWKRGPRQKLLSSCPICSCVHEHRAAQKSLSNACNA